MSAEYQPTMQLTATLSAWGTAAFEAVLKHELEQVEVQLLPLQAALTQSSFTSGANRSVRVISVADDAQCIRVKAGIFYTGIIAGCSCADDPTPVDEINEYCEVQLEIDKATAEATVTLLPQ